MTASLGTLLAWAETDAGRSGGGPFPGGSTPDAGFALLRRAADVLAAADAAPAWLRALGTELFRSQAEFNHGVVDLLEDLPWLHGRTDAAERVSARLGRWVRFSARTPLTAGVRGAAVFLAKGAALIATERAEAALLDALRQSNQSVLTHMQRLASSGGAAPIEDFRPRPGPAANALGPWTEAQQFFLEALRHFEATHRDRAWSRAAAVNALPPPVATAGSVPSVSVLWVGRGPPPTVDGVLEVLCPDEPGPGAASARRGDVADAKGEVIVRLATGDSLLPGGLEALAQPFLTASIELAYGDGLLSDGSAAFRPGWSPETLWSWNYVGGCFAMRAATAKKAQLSRARPALDWLLSPRFAEAKVVRVPRFVSRGPKDPGAVADLQVVEADLKRRDAEGVVRVHGAVREVELAPKPETKVSIIVPFKDRVELLEGLWASLQKYDPGVAWHLILANNGSQERRTARFLAHLSDPRVAVIDWNHPFNYSAINNAAAASAQGDLLLFLNNDVAARRSGWLANLAGYAQLRDVGVAGARLLYADGSIQHAGVAIGLKGLAGHVFSRWRPEFGATPFGPPDVTRNWSAVTGACLMIRKELFDEVGGFDPRLQVSGGDIALCLKVRERGLRVVCVAEADLWHYESQSRGRAPVPKSDVLREAALYRRLLEQGDPLYHPLLSTEAAHGGPGVRVESPEEHAVRTLRPWLSPSGA